MKDNNHLKIHVKYTNDVRARVLLIRCLLS